MKRDPFYSKTSFFDQSSQTSSAATRENVLLQLSESLRRNLNCKFTEEIHYNIPQSLACNYVNNNTITHLELSSVGLLSHDASILKHFLLQNPSLQVLRLAHNQLQDEGMITLSPTVGNHTHLEYLDVSFNDIGNDGCQCLAQSLLASTPLEYDEMKYDEHVHSKDEVCPASGYSALHTIIFKGNLITSEGASAFASVIQHGKRCCLSSIDLTGNSIEAEGVQALTSAIICNEESENYDLDTNHVARYDFSTIEDHKIHGMEELVLGRTNMGVHGCIAVAMMLESTSSIRMLSLAESNLGHIEITRLAQSLTRNRHRLVLESLCLSFNNITCSGVEVLTNALWGSETLRELRLDHNRIGDRGIQFIAALSTRSTIESLDVSNNCFAKSGWKSIFQSITMKDKLLSLSISGNPIDSPSAQALCNALTSNSSLKFLDVKDCSIAAWDQTLITRGIISNARTALQNLQGFELAPISVAFGLPPNLQSWNNEQLLRFVILMWDRYFQERDDLMEIQQSDTDKNTNHNRQKPMSETLIKEVAQNTMLYLEGGGYVEQFRFGGIRENEETVMQDDNFNISPEQKMEDFYDSEEQSCKELLLEWTYENASHFSKLKEKPYNSEEMGKLYEYFFSPQHPPHFTRILFEEEKQVLDCDTDLSLTRDFIETAQKFNSLKRGGSYQMEFDERPTRKRVKCNPSRISNFPRIKVSILDSLLTFERNFK